MVLATASEDMTVKIWDSESGDFERTLKGHTKSVQDMAFDAKGSVLVTCSADLTLPSGECKGDLRGHDNVVEVAKFAPVASHAFLRRLAGLPPVAVAKQNGSDGTSPDEPATSQFIISGSRDKTLRLWDCASLQLLHTFVGHDDWVRDFVVHPSGKTLLSVSDDKTMRVWDLITGRCAKTIEASEHFTTCIDFSSVNPLVATGSVDTTVQLWACR
ncbi:Lissencephaly-1 [Coemansia sp. RSA 370]|nr:Lissencephaly-1 [Coemansia sp. RSA 370]